MDVAEFQRFEQANKLWYGQLREALRSAGRHVLELTYEQLERELPDALLEIFAFLGLRQYTHAELLAGIEAPALPSGIELRSLTKQAPAALKDQISNIRKLPRELIARYLQEDGR